MENFIFSLHNISKTCNNREILKVGRLDIIRGKLYTILGPNGAGKSTLLKMLNLIELPTTGEIFYNQIPLPKLNLQKARHSMSMVFQKPYLYNMTVLKNVILGLQFHNYPTNIAKELAMNALTMVGMDKLAHQNAKTLSGGEAQRLALARAIAFQPEVLFLDEPTASLDPDNASLIENLILKMKTEGNTTLIMVTHNIFQAKRLADRVVFLYNGEMIEEGEKSQIFEAPINCKTSSFLSGESIY